MVCSLCTRAVPTPLQTGYTVHRMPRRAWRREAVGKNQPLFSTASTRAEAQRKQNESSLYNIAVFFHHVKLIESLQAVSCGTIPFFISDQADLNDAQLVKRRKEDV